MSVLINMEMPSSCGDCKAFVCYRQWAGDIGDCFCGITKNDAKAKEKNADCLLVPVPPHGRLIDVDKVLDELAHNLGIRSLDYLTPSERAIVSWFRDAPTIIPAEEGET